MFDLSRHTPDSSDLTARLQARAEQEHLSVEGLLERWLNRDQPDCPDPSTLTSPSDILQQISDAVITTDSNLFITSWNAAAERLYGWTEAEALGQPMDELLQTQWTETSREQVHATLETTGIWRGEMSQRTKNDRQCWIWVSVSQIRSASGTITGTITVNREITERKQAEENLRRSEEKYRLIAENTSDKIMIIEPDGRITYISPGYDQQWGREEGITEQFDITDIYRTIHPDDRDATFAQITEAIRQKKDHLTYTFRGQHAAGYYLWREDHARFNYDEAGNHINTYVISRDVTERKRTEEALHNSEAKFRLLVEQSLDGILLCDADGAVIEWNGAMEEIMGISRNEMLGKPVWDVHYMLLARSTQEAPAYEVLKETIQTGLQTGSLSVFEKLVEYDILLDNGRRRYLQIHTFPVSTGQGYLIASIARDVTYLRLAMQSLRASEERYRLIVETAQEGVWMLDAEDRTTFVNQRTADMLGYTREEMTGRPLLDFIYSRDQTAAKQHLRRRHDGSVDQYDFRFARKDGSEVWMIISATPLLSAEGKYLGTFGMLMDITARRKLDVQLRLHQTALESTANAIVITGADSRIEWVNPAFTTLTGYSLEEARGKSANLLKSGIQEAAFYSELWHTIKSGKVWQGRLINRRKDGSLYTEEQTITPVRDASGTITHFIAIKQDVTEREQAELLRLEQERLRASLRKEQEQNALIQRLISALSHDLRTPLSVIATSKDILVRYFDRLSEADRREKLDAIGRQTRNTLQMLEDTVRTLRGNGAEQPLRPAAVNLASFCQIITNEIQQTSGSQHQLRFVTDGQITTTLIDEVLISRILLNLLANAVKFSPPGSEIRLELGCRDQKIMLQVVDHGMGIAKQDQARIFEPFYRSESVRSINGSGLGLNIVRDCVERYQGSITVESEVGVGTTFMVLLPLFNDATGLPGR